MTQPLLWCLRQHLVRLAEYSRNLDGKRAFREHASQIGFMHQARIFPGEPVVPLPEQIVAHLPVLDRVISEREVAKPEDRGDIDVTRGVCGVWQALSPGLHPLAS